MRAAWYECLGHAADVLTVGETETPSPGSGEVLVRVAASGINPSDTKKRAGWLGGDCETPRPSAAVTPAAVTNAGLRAS